MRKIRVVDEVRCFLGFATKKFEGGRATDGLRLFRLEGSSQVQVFDCCDKCDFQISIFEVSRTVQYVFATEYLLLDSMVSYITPKSCPNNLSMRDNAHKSRYPELPQASLVILHLSFYANPFTKR